MIRRKQFLATLTLGATLCALPWAAQAQQFFRIGTGGTAGTYYPVGGMIANAVSQPGKIIATDGEMGVQADVRLLARERHLRGVGPDVGRADVALRAGALAWPRSAWQAGVVRPLAGRETTAELIRALAYPKFRLTSAEREDLLGDYLPWCETVAVPKGIKVPLCRDPFDRPLLALALAAVFAISRLVHAQIHLFSNYVPNRRRAFTVGWWVLLVMAGLVLWQLARRVAGL